MNDNTHSISTYAPHALSAELFICRLSGPLNTMHIILWVLNDDEATGGCRGRSQVGLGGAPPSRATTSD